MNYPSMTQADIWTETQSDADRLSAEGLPARYQKDAFEWWRGLCGDDMLPDIAHIDPLEIPISALPWTDLVGVTYDPMGFEIRLWGTHIVSAVGRDLKGTDFHEAGMLAAVRRLTHVVEAREPYFATIPLDWHTERYKRSTHYTSLGLPFQSETGEIPRILCFLSFGEQQ